MNLLDLKNRCFFRTQRYLNLCNAQAGNVSHLQRQFRLPLNMPLKIVLGMILDIFEGEFLAADNTKVVVTIRQERPNLLVGYC